MNFCNNKRVLKGITAFCPADSPSPYCQWWPGKGKGWDNMANIMEIIDNIYY